MNDQVGVVTGENVRKVFDYAKEKKVSEAWMAFSRDDSLTVTHQFAIPVSELSGPATAIFLTLIKLIGYRGCAILDIWAIFEFLFQNVTSSSTANAALEAARYGSLIQDKVGELI